MTRRTNGRRWIAAMAVCIAWLGTVTAPRAQETDLPTYGESVLVDLVNVEVWVTDRDGVPVRGLEAGDFKILEDGRPVEISHFREVDASTVTRNVLTQGSPEDSPAPAPVVAPVANADVGHLVVYFDELHLQLGGRKRLLRDLHKFLAETTVPAEQILIVRQGQRLVSENLFGSSEQQLAAALDRLAKPGPRSTLEQQQRWLTLNRLQTLWERQKESARSGTLPCEEFMQAASPEIDAYAWESQNRIEQTLDHLANVITFLAGLSGPKTLLYMSDGLQIGPGEDLLRFVTDICPAVPRETTPVALGAAMSDGFRRLTRHASANRVTIYAMQPQGLRAGFVGSAEQRTVDMQGMRSLQSAVRTSDREGLSFLAYETGGRAIFNQNSLYRQLVAIDSEISSYYSLAYQPPADGDGVEHRIEVRVPGDYRVRHRRGYRVKTRDEQLNERMQGALYLGLVSNPLQVRLAAGDPAPAGRKNQIRLHVMMPAERLVFLPVEDGAMARVAISVQALNEKGRLETNEQTTFRIAQPPADGPDSIDLIVPIELRDGVYDVVVGVRDDTSDQSSVVSTFLRVAPAAAN